MLDSTDTIASELLKNKFLFSEAPITQTLEVRNSNIGYEDTWLLSYYCSETKLNLGYGGLTKR